MELSDDVAPLSAVCETCQDMLCHQQGRHRGTASTLQLEFDHHTIDNDTLANCVHKTACYICRIILEKLKSRYTLTSSSAQGKAEISKPKSTCLTAIVKRVPYGSLETFRLDFKVENVLLASFILVNQGNDSEGGTPRPRSSATDSPEVFDLARRWIDQCVQNHDECNASDTSFYPTRLLEIIPVSGQWDFRSSVRLVSSKDSEHRFGQPKFEGRYVTLSHCWGHTLPLILETTSLERFQDAIHLDELPLTFQHAILSARRLKQRWIWIDALCIIQDSVDDWLHESTLMHEVYANSYCNISATASRNGSEGLFRSRDTHRFWSQSVTINAKDLIGNEDVNYDCTVLDLSFWEDSVEQAPVNRRSWVLQERLLSPRVVHWCHDQIAFECRKADRAECRPEGIPHLSMLRGELVEGARFKRIEPNAGRELRRLRLRKEESYSSQSRLTQMVNELRPRWYYYEIWKRVVEAYTKMGLTKASDRLIALSGIARMMKSQMESNGVKDEYVAGLWQRGIPSQLLWYVNEAEGPEPQPLDDNRPKDRDGSYSPFRAPTFSWASVETQRGVTFAEITKEGTKVSLEVVRLVYRTDDKFGILTDGYILLRGILRQILLVDTVAEERKKAHTSQIPEYSSSNIFTNFSTLARYAVGLPKSQPRVDTTPPKSLEGINRWSWTLLQDGKPSGRDYSDVYLDSPATEPTIFGIGAKVFIIPTLLTRRSLFCLMVQAVDGDYGVRYKRVGLTIIAAHHDLEVQDILTPPTNNAAEKGRYYWGPEARKTGESTICII